MGVSLLTMFQGFADIDALKIMGNPARHEHLPQHAGITRATWDDLMNRAADAGLVTNHGGGYYRLHPALPWFLAPTLHHTHGPRHPRLRRKNSPS